MNTPRALLVVQDCQKSKNGRRKKSSQSEKCQRSNSESGKKYLEKREPELPIYSSSTKTERKDGRKWSIEATTVLAFLYYVLQSSLILNLKF